MKDFKFDILLRQVLDFPPEHWDFNSIAEVVFNELLLIVQSSLYRLTEFEFYMNDQLDQYDIFAHKHQGYNTGQIRLHGAGIDIALEQGNFSGGILIRGIVEVDNEFRDTSHYIDGPWKIAQALFSKMHVNQTSFTIEWKQQSLPHKSYITAPRVGLRYRLKIDPHKQLPYLYKPWRYLSLPIVTSNDKFLIALEMIKQNRPEQEIVQLLRYKLSTILSYKALMQEGTTLAKEDLSKLNNTIPDRCRSFGYSTMLYAKKH